jgi:hypothetical protein
MKDRFRTLKVRKAQRESSDIEGDFSEAASVTCLDGVLKCGFVALDRGFGTAKVIK